MRNANAVVATMGFVVFAGGSAHAQPAVHPSQAQRDKAQPLNLQHAQLGTHGLGESARSRMRSGDCAAALDLFDEALRTSIEATLYRDRGICHEKLGHPYPARDDYRRYLTSAPDATDADSIRERLELLDDKMSGRVRPAPDDDSPFAPHVATSTAASTTDKSAALAMGPAGQPSTRVDTYEDEGEDELRGPLRRGKGWSLAPFFAEHKWFFNGRSFGDSETWAECVGGELRYAPSAGGALLVEVGYEHFNSTAVDPAVVYGLTSMIAYEFRFPLDERYDNQFFLAPGVGYEQLQIAASDPNLPSKSEGAVTGRVRLGYRHLMGLSTAFEVSLDGGGGEFFLFDGSGASSSAGLAGVNLAIAWGL